MVKKRQGSHMEYMNTMNEKTCNACYNEQAKPNEYNTIWNIN